MLNETFSVIFKHCVGNQEEFVFTSDIQLSRVGVLSSDTVFCHALVFAFIIFLTFSNLKLT